MYVSVAGLIRGAAFLSALLHYVKILGREKNVVFWPIEYNFI